MSRRGAEINIIARVRIGLSVASAAGELSTVGGGGRALPAQSRRRRWVTPLARFHWPNLIRYELRWFFVLFAVKIILKVIIISLILLKNNNVF